MNFEKLNLDTFSKEKLTDNKLRSINGGAVETCVEGGGTDYLYNDGSTEYDDGCYSNDLHPLGDG